MGANVPLTVLQGNDTLINLAVLQEDGVSPQDCVGLRPVLIIKPGQRADDSAAIATLTFGAGLLWVDQAAGTLTASLTKEMLATAGYWWWRLDLFDGNGDRTTSEYGYLTIIAM